MVRALLVERQGEAARLVDLDEAALPPGAVEVRVRYSSLNYKDALAITGRGPVLRAWPMVPGIDLAGVVERSTDPRWPPGDPVLVAGQGLGETRWGGLIQRERVDGDALWRIPAPFDARHAMALGTAGYTAALCVLALQRHGIGDGPVLVTGASGGVGSIAVLLLGALGYPVAAATGRPAQADYLRDLGATEIVDRATLAEPGRALQSERWAAVVDTVGSHTLANACAATQRRGAVAACGLAQGGDFPASVMPFILRGVTLYGINSVYDTLDERARAWDLLARHISPERLDGLSRVVTLEQAITAASDLLDGRLHGHTVVDVDA